MKIRLCEVCKQHFVGNITAYPTELGWICGVCFVKEVVKRDSEDRRSPR